MKKTKKAYEQYLNTWSPEHNENNWIIGGVFRRASMWHNTYGSALRRHDPIAFEVGFNEWKKSNN